MGIVHAVALLVLVRVVPWHVFDVLLHIRQRVAGARLVRWEPLFPRVCKEFLGSGG